MLICEKIVMLGLNPEKERPYMNLSYYLPLAASIFLNKKIVGMKSKTSSFFIWVETHNHLSDRFIIRPSPITFHRIFNELFVSAFSR